MNFRFNVHLTQQDYLEFNKIVMYEMPAGKKIVKFERIGIAIFTLLGFCFIFFGNFGQISFTKIF